MNMPMPLHAAVMLDVAGTTHLTIGGPHPVGYHSLSLYADHPSESRSVAVLVAPERVAGPIPTERRWGVFAPLHAITRSIIPTLTEHWHQVANSLL